MYLIVEGRVRVVQHVYNQNLNKTDIVQHCQLSKRQSFGESAVIFDTRRTTSVQSLSNGLLVQADKCLNSVLKVFTSNTHINKIVSSNLQ